MQVRYEYSIQEILWRLFDMIHVLKMSKYVSAMECGRYNRRRKNEK